MCRWTLVASARGTNEPCSSTQSNQHVHNTAGERASWACQDEWMNMVVASTRTYLFISRHVRAYT